MFSTDHFLYFFRFVKVFVWHLKFVNVKNESLILVTLWPNCVPLKYAFVFGFGIKYSVGCYKDTLWVGTNDVIVQTLQKQNQNQSNVALKQRQ